MTDKGRTVSSCRPPYALSSPNDTHIHSTVMHVRGAAASCDHSAMLQRAGRSFEQHGRYSHIRAEEGLSSYTLYRTGRLS
eukprot:3038194-Amphidinium_carterae.1